MLNKCTVISKQSNWQSQCRILLNKTSYSTQYSLCWELQTISRMNMELTRPFWWQGETHWRALRYVFLGKGLGIMLYSLTSPIFSKRPWSVSGWSNNNNKPKHQRRSVVSIRAVNLLSYGSQFRPHLICTSSYIYFCISVRISVITNDMRCLERLQRWGLRCVFNYYESSNEVLLHKANLPSLEVTRWTCAAIMV